MEIIPHQSSSFQQDLNNRVIFDQTYRFRQYTTVQRREPTVCPSNWQVQHDLSSWLPQIPQPSFVQPLSRSYWTTLDFSNPQVVVNLPSASTAKGLFSGSVTYTSSTSIEASSVPKPMRPLPLMLISLTSARAGP